MLSRPTVLLLATTLLAIGCFEDSRSGDSGAAGASGSSGSSDAEIAALNQEVATLSAALDQLDAKYDELSEKVDEQSTELDEATTAIEEFGGLGDSIIELDGRVTAVEARGTVVSATGSGTGTCAYVTMDVEAGRPVVVTAGMRATFSGARSGPSFYGGGSASATVDSSIDGAVVASFSLGAYQAVTMYDSSQYYASWSFYGTDTNMTTFTPSATGEVVITMLASGNSATGVEPAPTIGRCSIVAFQL